MRTHFVQASAKASKLSIDFGALNRTPNHVLYNKVLQDPRTTIVVGVGAPGSGKTLLASANAIQGLYNKEVKRVVITRPNVTMGADIGYLPGEIHDKMLPFLLPIYDAFKEYITVQRLKEYINNGEIEIASLAYLRGRTFHNSWVIADEVQNTSVAQMRSLLTRIGQGSKLTMTGDLEQCDLDGINGLADFVQRFERYLADNPDAQSVRVVRFGEEDIVRSDIVREVMNIYNY